MSKIDILVSYWTLAVGTNPAAQSPSEKHCLHDFRERVEAAANGGYTGMGFWHDDIFKLREGIGFNEMKSIPEPCCWTPHKPWARARSK